MAGESSCPYELNDATQNCNEFFTIQLLSNREVTVSAKKENPHVETASGYQATAGVGSFLHINSGL
ncbi:hypothetical protein J22TS3_01090 [Paenibacillus sp. J22TS3]|nr:hypothetical protein J22TS3_01090 [Paenibacillus sp. J22TS3]